MVDVWSFSGAGKVRLTCTDGEVYEGVVLEVCEPEEDGILEDSITIELKDGRIIGFAAGEIEKIERLERQEG